MVSTEKFQDPITKPRVSIFHMFYNQRIGLEEAVAASFSQDYENLEIVLSDDCSSDGTYEQLQCLVDDYDGPHDVRLFRNEKNLGLVGNFNTCADRTEGNLIVQCNGDDISRTDRVRLIVDSWSSSDDIVLVHSLARYIEADGSVGELLNRRQESDYGHSPAAFVAHNYFALGATAAFDRRIFEEFGVIPEFALVEDCIMPLRARLIGRISKVDEVLVEIARGGLSDGESYSDVGARNEYFLNTRVTNAWVYLSDFKGRKFEQKPKAIFICWLLIAKGWLYSNGLGPIYSGMSAGFRGIIKRMLAQS